MAYTYANVVDIHPQTDGKVNVFGVVKYFRKPTKASSGQYNALYTIIDPSVNGNYEDGVRCNLFAFEEENLPRVSQVGDVIRFHRMTVTTFDGRVQLQGRRGYSWVVFNNVDPYNTAFSHGSSSVSDEDMKTVTSLLKWYGEIKHNLQDACVTNNTLLCQVKLDTFFNCTVMVLRVVQFENEPNHCMLVVSDGTKVRYSSLRHKGIEKHPLSGPMKNFCFEISVFDDHLTEALKLVPNEVVQIVNVHAKSVSQPVAEVCKQQMSLVEIEESEGWTEMLLHTGKQYGRGIFLLPLTDPRVQEVVKTTKELEKSLFEYQDPPRALQESVTVTDYPLQDFKLLDIIKKSNFPARFRLRAKVISVRPSNVINMVVGLCGTCDEFVILSEVVRKEVENNEHCQCVRCKDDVMKLTYAFEMLLEDSTGFLQVIAVDDEAVLFFNNVKPNMLLGDVSLLTNYQGKFDRMSNAGTDNVASLPWVEMCVYAYKHPETNASLFRMFGTSLI